MRTFPWRKDPTKDAEKDFHFYQTVFFWTEMGFIADLIQKIKISFGDHLLLNYTNPTSEVCESCEITTKHIKMLQTLLFYLISLFSTFFTASPVYPVVRKTIDMVMKEAIFSFGII